MKRRTFGLLAGTSIAATTITRPARAQAATPDPSLLTTTLTPMGGERAGNADGSIPPWTGGLVGAPVPAGQSVRVQVFQDEQPLYTVDASNMAQYANLLTEGTKVQITKFGLSIKVYKTHRTAAAPQYIYDNTAKNVTSAKFEPNGGRFGFTGAFCGVPFPIIDESDPEIAGLQLIWNHLTGWIGLHEVTRFAPGSVVINGRIILVNGALSKTYYPYYDPTLTLETFGGYYSKGHYWSTAPSSADGQETLVWHSTNVTENADIVWTLLNGQGRVRKAPNENFDSPNPDADGISNVDEASCFYGNPSQYDWKLIEKKEMLVPYNCNAMLFVNSTDYLLPHFPDPNVTRWEKHRMWVVEATLHPGERNMNSKRRLYFDEDTRFALLGEGYDGNDNLVKAYAVYNEPVPSLPGTIEMNTATFSLITGDYVFNGCSDFGKYKNDQTMEPIAPSDEEPQTMAANASF